MPIDNAPQEESQGLLPLCNISPLENNLEFQQAIADIENQEAGVSHEADHQTLDLAKFKADLPPTCILDVYDVDKGVKGVDYLYEMAQVMSLLWTKASEMPKVALSPCPILTNLGPNYIGDCVTQSIPLQMQNFLFL